MGQRNSKSQGKASSIPQFRPDFEVIRIIDDPNYGRVKLIRDKSTSHQMILREFVFDTKQQFEEELKFFQDRAAFDHPNIVQVIGYNTTESQNLCSSLYKVSVFIEILSKELDTDLKDHIRNNLAYSENDLFIIADSVIEALCHLQTKNMAHGDVRPVNIFLSAGSYKVTDPKLEVDKNANGLAKAIISKQRTLLTPQLLAKVPTGKFEHNADKYKTDVFSLGVTLQALATLTSPEGLYDYGNGEFNEKLLNERLDEVKRRYSPFTHRLISDMLNADERSRPDFVDLRENLLPYKNEIQGRLPLPFASNVSSQQSNKEGGEKVKKSYQTAVHETYNVITNYGNKPSGNSEMDDLEARIAAALKRSQETYTQVNAFDSNTPTAVGIDRYQSQVQYEPSRNPSQFQYEATRTVEVQPTYHHDGEAEKKAPRPIGFEDEEKVKRSALPSGGDNSSTTTTSYSHHNQPSNYGNYTTTSYTTPLYGNTGGYGGSVYTTTSYTGGYETLGLKPTTNYEYSGAVTGDNMSSGDYLAGGSKNVTVEKTHKSYLPGEGETTTQQRTNFSLPRGYTAEGFEKVGEVGGLIYNHDVVYETKPVVNYTYTTTTYEVQGGVMGEVGSAVSKYGYEEGGNVGAATGVHGQ